MTQTKARQWLRDVRKLIQQYVDGKCYKGCPLCRVDSPEYAVCDSCLWLIFSKIHCSDHMKNHRIKHNLEVGTTLGDPRWVKLSIRRLRRWEKRLLTIIEGE